MKRFTLIVLTIFSFIILCAPVITVTSQTSNPSTYNGRYKVKVGDSNRYDVMKIQNYTADYITASAPSSNGTEVPYNVTKGVYFTFEVTAVNTSTSGNQVVYGAQTIYTPNHQTFHFNNSPVGSVINLGFDTYSDALAYYNQSSIGGSSHNISRHGDIIELSSISAGYSNISNSYIQTFNWKTGWLESIHVKLYTTNGTIIIEELIQRHSEDIIRSITNFSASVLELGSIIILIAIPVIIGISYRNFSQASRISGSSQSFPQYLQSKVRYSKKKPKKKPIHSADKALETIESILEETGANSK